MSIESLFAELTSLGRKAFVPFITAGDPDLDFTVELIRELSHCGSSIIELGIPYSDPIADGAVIQASYTRALSKGLRIDDIFTRIGPLSRELATPLLAMASFSLVQHRGAPKFVDQALQAGFSGAVVPDLLSQLDLLQLSDHPWSQRKGDEKCRDGRVDNPKALISKDVQKRKLRVQRIEPIV